MQIYITLYDNQIVKQEDKQNNKSSIKVLGFYISGQNYKNLNFSLISTLAVLELVPNKNGSFSSKLGLDPNLIAYAHEKRVKVIVVVGSNDKDVIDSIFASNNSDLIDNLLSITQIYDLDGINIDFESVNKINSITRKPNRQLIVKFMKDLSSKFWSNNLSYIINIDLPDSDPDGVWDVMNLQNYVTDTIIMSYDMYYGNSSVAGPPSPIDDDYPDDPTVRNSINFYSNSGLKKRSILLGIPYYGYIWPTVGEDRKSVTTGIGEYRSYNEMTNLSNKYGRRWDNVWKTPWFAYKKNSQWYQGHYDDNESLGLKYDLVISENLSGIAIFPLGYDEGRSELWEKIEEKFTVQR